MKVGDRVKTNKAFSKLWKEMGSDGVEWRGRITRVLELEKRTAYRVRVDGMPKLQTIAGKFLTKEK